MTKSKIVNAMTVDVEDYFQVLAFEPYIKRQQWDHLPHRVVQNTNKILAHFDEHRVKATFFTLGWIAERYPALIRDIVAAGHEVAAHGYDHIRVTEQGPTQFRQDIKKTKSLLEDICGQSVVGYRAPSFSICAKNLWALSVLEEEGFLYSSSIYPVKHDIYGMPEAPRFMYKPSETTTLLEIPVSTMKLINKNIPCGGGGFFRLYPYSLSKAALSYINLIENQPVVFYFHPWEIDPDQPRQHSISFKTRFRHYLNLDRVKLRLERLTQDFAWDTMQAVFLKNEASSLTIHAVNKQAQPNGVSV